MLRWTRRLSMWAGLSLLVLPTLAEGQGAGGSSTRPKPHLWWDDAAVVELLGLEDATRAAMDELHRTYGVLGTSAALRNSRHGFKSALIDRQWETAETELQGIAAPTIHEGKLKIEVLKLLSAEQHQLLLQRVPTVFRRKWKPASGWKLEPEPQLAPKGQKQAEPEPESP